MILLSGPTGSGKTTTLYVALKALNTVDVNIVTVEDPVEYVLDGINQAQVHSKIGANFATYLRSILRQDPDVIMIGEIRDQETAEIAVRSATTGHLVLSTLHTNDAPGVINRLIDMGVEPFMVASSLIGAVSQRLS
jgi:type IV pilus assembly protein PilB